MIYLNGLYVEPHFYKGTRGFRVFHDCQYFKEKFYYHTSNDVAEKWMKNVMEHAACYDVNKKYERLNMLGKGKFSTVYLCHPQDVSAKGDEMLAMKFIEKPSLTRKEREFLRDEIQIIRSINHPNVVEMRDAFETFNNMFIMMECVQGGELFEHIKDTEINEREACLITNQVLEALQYLHMCGIVHRDLKPENIMVELDQATGEVH